MDSLFMANEQERETFLRYLMRACRCTYICLWIHHPHPPYCLSFLDGFYDGETHDQHHHPSSSSSSISSNTNPAKRLFDQYKKSTFLILPDHEGRVPGLAFKRNMPYLELRESDLPRFAYLETQFQFYLEARIKTAVFLGCRHGEIELGTPNVTQDNLEMKIKTWFPLQPQPLTEQNRQSSSSSSLRSVSLDSPDSSSLIFNINTTSPFQNQTLKSTLHDFGETARNIRIPETILSPSREFSSSSAFRIYGEEGVKMAVILKKKSMVERFVVYIRGIMEMKRQQEEMAVAMQGGASQFSETQMHHMISERKRRQKLNENFQALKSLLPPGSKKDKASVLASAREYVQSLQAQISKLSETNKRLEERISHAGPGPGSVTPIYGGDVRIENVEEITAGERIFTLRVTVEKSEEYCVMDLVSRILGFLKGVWNAKMEFMEAGLSRFNEVLLIMRLKIEGKEWDESSFRETVRRVVGDMAAQ